MKRSLVFLALLVSAALSGAAQTTTVTAASGGLKINGKPVNGTVTISSQGPVAVSGGGLILPSSSSGYVTQCSVSAGAITGTCAVPSSALSNGGNGVLYSVLVTDAFAGRAQILTGVSISGASWALDQYVPPATVSTAAAFTYTTGSGAPGGGCSSTSLYADTSGSALAFYGCKGGSWVSVGTAAGNVTLSAITALGTLTNPISGNAATASNFDHSPNQCANGNVPTGITSHGDASGCAPAGGTFAGGTVANPITAPSVSTNGSGASGLTITPDGTDPTAPTNSVTITVPQSVPTPYDFELPTNVTSAAGSALPVACQFYAAVTGPPATPAKLVCALTSSSGSGLPSPWAAGTVTGNYEGLGLDGSLTASTMIGVMADKTGAFPDLLLMSPSGGSVQEKIANVTVVQEIAGSAPTGACSSDHRIILSSTDGKLTWCNTSNSYVSTTIGASGGGSALPSQLQAGQVTGNYYGFGFNGSLATPGMAGIFADSTGSDKNLYSNVPTGGQFQFKINNVSEYTVEAGTHATGTCSVSPVMVLYGDGYFDYCDGTNWHPLQPGGNTGGSGLPSQLQAGQVSGNYYGISFNGSLVAAALNGFFADSTGSDKNLYFNVPTGGQLQFKTNNNAISTITAQGLWQPVATPADNATCTAGTYMGTDGTYLYVCTATNTVKRTAALSTY